MSGFRALPLLLALCALAVAALAVGPFLYRSLLPEAADVPATPCGFVAVTVGLFLFLLGAVVWQLRRRRRPPEAELDKRLWEAVMGGGEEPPRADGD